MTKLLVVGGGKMGEALLGGLLAQGPLVPADVAVVEPHEGSLRVRFAGLEAAE